MAMIAQEPRRMDMYIKYKMQDAIGSGNVSDKTTNLLHLFFVTSGKIIADGLMVSEFIISSKIHSSNPNPT